MTANVESIEDLEAMLADLDDLELDEEPAPASKPAVTKEPELSDADLEDLDAPEESTVQAVKEPSDDELDDLDLDDLVDAPVAETKPIEAPVDQKEVLNELAAEAPKAEEKPVIQAEPGKKSNPMLEMVAAKRKQMAEQSVTGEPAAKTETKPAKPKAEKVEPVVKAEPILDDDAEIDALLDAAVSAKAPEPEPEKPKKTAKAGSAASAITPPATTFAFAPSNALSTFIDELQLRQDLEFTEATISMAMTRQAPLFAHYSTLAHKAQYQADRAKQQVDLVEAQLDQAYRDKFISEGVKASENMVKAAITRDAAYQEAQNKRHEAQAIAEMVKSAADSFRHRRDMLIQVGADLREEKKGSPSTKEHAGQAAMRSLRNAS